MIPPGTLTLGQNCSLANHFSSGFFHYHPHPLQGGAGAYHIIHEDNFFIADQLLVLFIHDQGLRLAGGNGQGFGDQCCAHVRFVGFAQDDVWFFRLHSEGVCQWDGLGFCCDQDVKVHSFERPG